MQDISAYFITFSAYLLLIKEKVIVTNVLSLINNSRRHSYVLGDLSTTPVQANTISRTGHRLRYAIYDFDTFKQSTGMFHYFVKSTCLKVSG